MIRIITNFWESACFDGDGGGGGGGGGSPSGATASGASTNSGGLSSGSAPSGLGAAASKGGRSASSGIGAASAGASGAGASGKASGSVSAASRGSAPVPSGPPQSSVNDFSMASIGRGVAAPASRGASVIGGAGPGDSYGGSVGQSAPASRGASTGSVGIGAFGRGAVSTIGQSASGRAIGSAGVAGTNASLPGAMSYARGDLASGFGSVVGRAAPVGGYGQQAGFTSGVSAWSGGSASYTPPSQRSVGPSMSGATFDIPARTTNAGNVARSSLPPEFAAGYQQFAAEQVGKPSYVSAPVSRASARGSSASIAQGVPTVADIQAFATRSGRVPDLPERSYTVNRDGNVSRMTAANAPANMQGLLGGKYQALEGQFREATGRALPPINDAIAKSGTSRALDFDTRDLSNAEKAALIDQARQVGFRGIGLWGYKNSTYAGIPVADWNEALARNTVPDAAKTMMAEAFTNVLRPDIPVPTRSGRVPSAVVSAPVSRASARGSSASIAQAQLNAREAAALYGRTRSARSGSAMPPARGLDRTDLASMPPAGTFNARAGMWSSPPAIAGQVYGLDEEGRQTAPASMTAAFDNPNQSLNTPAFNAGLQAYDSNVTAMANPSRGGLNSARSDFTTVQQPALTPADRRAAEDMSFQSYQLTYGSLPSLPGRENMPPSRAQMNAYDQFVAAILSGEANKTGNPYESVVGNRTAVDVFGKPLGRMTIAEVEAAQKAMAPHPTLNSKALGAYQFTGVALPELTTKTGIDKSLPMNQAVQDFLGLARTQQRADRATKNGKIDVDKFAVELSKEFAALANPKTGISYYAKDRVNKASIPAEQTMALAKSLVESGVVVPGRSISEMGKKANQAIANPAAQRSAPYGGTLGRTAPAPTPAAQRGLTEEQERSAAAYEQQMLKDLPAGSVYSAETAPSNPVYGDRFRGFGAGGPLGGLLTGNLFNADGTRSSAGFVGSTGDGEGRGPWGQSGAAGDDPAPTTEPPPPPAVNVVEASRRFVDDYIYPTPPVKWPRRELTYQP